MEATVNKLICAAAVLTMVVSSGTSMAQQSQNPSPAPWDRCCGTGQWRMGGPGMMRPGPGQGQAPGMMGQGMMGSGYGSMPRHHFAMMSGIPAPYRSVSSPLPRKAETVEHGGRIYAENCAACHGPTGAGDGAAGRDLSPPPGNLAWLSQMPMVQWDPFMYWTVAEGGAQFKTAMPAFKDRLSKEDIWAVVAYIQAHLPQTPK
jgi:mono/diheme cytochrome c family protein